MSSSQKPFRRKQYLINPEFQVTVIGFFIGLAVVTIGVFFWSIHLVLTNFEDTLKTLSLPEGHTLLLFVAENRKAMNIIFGTTSILLFVFLVIGGLILSHHIAGPIYRLKKHIQLVNSGESFGDLSFRKKDFFQDILPDYNAMLTKIREWKSGQS